MIVNFSRKRHDTDLPFTAQLLYTDPVTAVLTPWPNLAGATVVLNMSTTSGTVVINRAAVSIVDVPTAAVSYTWQVADVANVGKFKIEIEVTSAAGKVLTFPTEGYVILTIGADIA